MASLKHRKYWSIPEAVNTLLSARGVQITDPAYNAIWIDYKDKLIQAVETKQLDGIDNFPGEPINAPNINRESRYLITGDLEAWDRAENARTPPPSNDQGRPKERQENNAPADKETFQQPEPASAPPESDNPPLSAKERGNLQKQIAVLALLLSGKSSKYQWAGKPNAAQIAQAVQHLLDDIDNEIKKDLEHTELNRYGVSSTELRRNIAEGIKLLFPIDPEL